MYFRRRCLKKELRVAFFFFFLFFLFATSGLSPWSLDQGTRGYALADTDTDNKGAGNQGTSEKVNLNTASQAQLEELPGIGPVKAKRIIAGRPYQKFDDLLKIKGIGEKTLENLLPLVTIGEPLFPPEPEQPGEDVETNPDDALVNINEAGAGELETLPGIGQKFAIRIVDYRVLHPFEKKEDLMKVKGIGEKTYSGLKDLVTVGDGVQPAEFPVKGLDVNKADFAQLLAVPGIGESKVEKIISGRPYSSLDELTELDGFTVSLIDRLKQYLEVGVPFAAIQGREVKAVLWGGLRSIVPGPLTRDPSYEEVAK